MELVNNTTHICNRNLIISNHLVFTRHSDLYADLKNQIAEVKAAVASNRDATSTNTLAIERFRKNFINFIDIGTAPAKGIALFEPFLAPLEAFKKTL